MSTGDSYAHYRLFSTVLESRLSSINFLFESATINAPSHLHVVAMNGIAKIVNDAFDYEKTGTTST